MSKRKSTKNEFKRNCPLCNKELLYSCKTSLLRASKNSVCRSCSKKGNPPWILGKHHSEETKNKISINHNKKSAWSKGKSFSKLHKQNLSLSKIGHVVTESTKRKLSISLKVIRKRRR